MPLYYQQSFLKIVQHIKEKFSSILDKDERGLLDELLLLPDDPQRLFIRMFLRKDGWVRQAKLQYDEIDVGAAVEGLLLGDFLDLMSEPSTELLTIEELKAVCRKLGIHGGSKAQLGRVQLEALIRGAPERVHHNTLASLNSQLAVKRVCLVKSAVVREACGSVVRLRRHAALHRMVSGLFFMNTTLMDGALDMSAAILTDLNRARYPPYVPSDPLLIFPTRDAWLGFYDALVHEAQVHKALESGVADILSLVRDLQDRARLECAQQHPESMFLRRYTAGWVYCRCLGAASAVLEQLGMHEVAVEVLCGLLEQDAFCHGKRGKWWDRLALDLQRHCKRPEAAQEACRQGLADPHVRSAARYGLEHRLYGNRKHASDPPVITIDAGTLHEEAASGSKIRFGPRRLTVEQHALEHFEEDGWHGLVSESAVWTTLFACLFWDILFGPWGQPVFPTPFLAAPLDLHTDVFYEDRREVLEERLALISMDPVFVRDTILGVFERHSGTIAVGASWTLDPELLRQIAAHVGGPALAVIMREFAVDYRHATSGMPDLVLWRDDGAVQFCEVKSVRDRLSAAQRHWFSILSANSLPMVVCRIREHR